MIAYAATRNYFIILFIDLTFDKLLQVLKPAPREFIGEFPEYQRHYVVHDAEKGRNLQGIWVYLGCYRYSSDDQYHHNFSPHQRSDLGTMLISIEDLGSKFFLQYAP